MYEKLPWDTTMINGYLMISVLSGKFTGYERCKELEIWHIFGLTDFLRIIYKRISYLAKYVFFDALKEIS